MVYLLETINITSKLFAIASNKRQVERFQSKKGGLTSAALPQPRSAVSSESCVFSL